MLPAILLAHEAEDRLRRLEDSAIGNIHSSREMLAAGILDLHHIFSEGLWAYARDEDGVPLRDIEGASWSDYLYLFCARAGISRSSLYMHLNTTRLWIDRLGRSEEQLVTVGLSAAGHVREIVHYDARSDSLGPRTAEVLDNLPPGETFIERVNARLDQVYDDPLPPPYDIVRSLRIDTAGQPDVTYRIIDGLIWWMVDTGDSVQQGVINQDNMPNAVKDDLYGKLRIREGE